MFGKCYALCRAIKVSDSLFVVGEFSAGCCLYVRGDIFEAGKVQVGMAFEIICCYLSKDPGKGIAYITAERKVSAADLLW